ncbi:MAG: ABC transporter substrate-binding protein [Alphaproteobacteria bacterium]
MVNLPKIALGAALALVVATPALAAEITIAIGSEPTTLDPQARDDGGERAINDNIFETLMARTPEGDLVPGLATAEPTQIDETTWEFTLRDGISFHNGEPFDAAAVVHSVERIIDPEFNSEQSSFFASIVGATAVDPLTVQIVTDGPDPILPSRMYWMKMVPPAYSGDDAFATAPIGTGPYVFDSWQRGSAIVLTANPDYWGEAPAIETVNYRFIEEPGTRLAGLLSGQYDLITNLQPEFVDQVPNAAHVSGLELPIVILSAISGPTQDVRVRQALNYAVDKEVLAEHLFEGYAQVSHGQLLAPSYFGYNPDVAGYSYDPDRARALLEEAGAVGVEIELIGTSGRWLKDRELVEVIAGFWTQVGVTPVVRIFEFNEYLNRLFDRQTRGDAIFVVSSNELMDADRPFSAYYSMNGIGASNQDEEMAAMIDAARTETDEAAREALYHQIVQHAFDQAYFLWLLNIEDVYGISERLVWTPRVDAKLLVSEMAVAE